MALLDVSDVLLDPDFMDLYIVRRRTEAISDKGRSTVTNVDTPNTPMVVCSAGPNDLKRLLEYDVSLRYISIVTPFQLRGPATQSDGSVTKPDLIQYLGDWFIVVWLDPYPQYGQGFTQAIAASTSIVDN